MTVALVVITIVLLVALDYFVLRKRLAVRQHRTPRPSLEPLSTAAAQVPQGVFLQPTFTWSRIRTDGDVVLGVHPLLLGLLGSPYHIELLRDGTQVERGAPLARLARAGRQLTVRSPVTGRVTAVNPAVRDETAWVASDDPAGSWFYRIRPAAIADEVPRWMIADRAAAWTRHQYDLIRALLANAGGSGPVGATMADGGEIPIGILAALDEGAWDAFQTTFLDPPA